MYLHWALSRYIGLFEHLDDAFSPPRLTLSDAGHRITGNQRRVTSEEMGIGFGALLANRWFKQTGAAGLPVSIVDVDVALDDRYVFAGGSRHAVRAIKDRRPDYLLIAPDPSSRRNYRVRALECKGTSSSISYAVRQLASAAEQLTGITVGGHIPKGLAVSTVTMNDQLSYLAVDPEEDAEPSYPVNADMIGQAAGFRFQDNVADVPPHLLTNASLRASWATLADFSGNLPALDRWAPGVMRRRLARRQRQRVTFDTPYGPARGTSVTMDVDGQRLHIKYAADAEIDQQMTGQPEAIANAQLGDQICFEGPADDVGLAPRSLARRFSEEVSMTWRAAFLHHLPNAWSFRIWNTWPLNSDRMGGGYERVCDLYCFDRFFARWNAASVSSVIPDLSEIGSYVSLRYRQGIPK